MMRCFDMQITPSFWLVTLIMDSYYSKRHLIIYLDIRNSIYDYCYISRKFSIDIMKEKVKDILEAERDKNDLLSITYGFGLNEATVKYLVKEIDIKSVFKQNVHNLIDFMKSQISKRMASKRNFNQKFNFEKTLKTLISHSQEFFLFNRIVFLMNDETILQLEEKLTRNKECFSQNNFIVEIVASENRLFKADNYFFRCRFKHFIKGEFQNFNIFLYDLKAKSLHFETSEIFKPSPTIFSLLPNLPRRSNSYNTIGIQMFVRLKLLQNWKFKTNSVTSSEIIHPSIAKFNCLICIVGETIEIKYFANNDVDDAQIDQFIEQDTFLYNFATGAFDFQRLTSTKIPISLEDAYKLFYIKTFSFMIDDSVDIESRSQIFTDLSENLFANFQRILVDSMFICKQDDLTIIKYVHKLSRNFYKIDFSFVTDKSLLMKTKFKAMFQEFKKQILDIHPEITHVPRPLMQLVRMKYRGNNHQGAREKYPSIYAFQKFTFYLQSNLNDNKYSVKRYFLFNAKINFLEFYEQCFERKLNKVFAKMGYKVVANIEQLKSALIFLKLFDQKGQSQGEKLTNLRALSVIKLIFFKSNVNTIQWKVHVPNPFLDLHGSILRFLEADFNKVKKYFDGYTIPLIIYLQILKNIHKELGREDEKVFKQTITWLKYEWTLLYFTAQKKDFNFTNDKLIYIENYRSFCMLEIQKFTNLSWQNKIVSDSSIAILLKKTIVSEVITLLSSDSPKFNKTLFESYNMLFGKFCEYNYKMHNNRRFYFKLMRPEIYVVYEPVLSENELVISVNYYLICLKCIKDRLKIECSENVKLPFDSPDLNCKYKLRDFSKIRAFTIETIKNLANITFVFSLKENSINGLFHGKFVEENPHFYVERLRQEFELSHIKTLFKIAYETEPKRVEAAIESIGSVFDYVFGMFFQEDINYDSSSAGYSKLYNINFSKINDKFKIPDKISPNHSLVRAVEEYLTGFTSSLSSISSNINLVKIQFYVKTTKKTFTFSCFKDILKLIEKENGKDKKIFLTIRILMPNFAKITNRIKESEFKQMKSSIGSVNIDSNHFNYILYSAESFVYEFMPVCEQICQSFIMKTFQAILSSFFFELYFVKQDSFADKHKFLCKILQYCNDKQVINIHLPEKNQMNPKNIVNQLRNEKYKVVSLEGKEKIHSILPNQQPASHFYNYIIYKNKIEIFSYASISFTVDEILECPKCKIIQQIIKSSGVRAYISLMRELARTFFSDHHKSYAPEDCMQLCSVITDILILFYNYTASIILNEISTSYEIKLKSIDTDPSQEKSEPLLICSYRDDLNYEDINIRGSDIYKNLVLDLDRSVIRNVDYFFIKIDESEAVVKINFTETIKTDDSGVTHSVFTLLLDFYSSITEKNLKFFKLINQNISRRINNQFNKKLEEMLAKTNELQRNSPVLNYVNSIFYGFEVKMDIPKINIGALVIYLNETLDFYFKKVLGGVSREKQFIQEQEGSQFEYDSQSLNLKKYTIQFLSEDYSYFYMNDQKQLVSSGIYYMEHDVKSLNILYRKEMETRDDSLLIGIFDHNEYEGSESWYLNSFITDGQISKSYFKNGLKQFKYKVNDRTPKEKEKVERAKIRNTGTETNDRLSRPLVLTSARMISIDSESRALVSIANSKKYTISFAIKKRSKEDLVGPITEKLFELLKSSYFEYYLEMVFSVYLLKENFLRVNKTYENFLDVVRYLFSKKPAPVSFYHKKFDNFSYKIYLFCYFLEICRLVKNVLKDFSTEITFVYQYNNLKPSGVNQNAYSRRKDSIFNLERINSGFEDEASNAINIADTDIDKFKDRMTEYFKKRNTLFEAEELNFYLLAVPSEMAFDDLESNGTPMASRDSQSKPSSNLNVDDPFFKEKYENLMMFVPEYLKLKADDNTLLKFPPRRFFYMLNVVSKKMEVFSYNIKPEINEKINKSISDYGCIMNTKREIDKFVCIQKLGLAYRSENLKTSESAKKEKHEGSQYSVYLSERRAENPNFPIRNFTDIIESLIAPDSNDIFLSQMLSNSHFQAKILKDFYKLQFFFINNFNSKSLKPVSLREVS